MSAPEAASAMTAKLAALKALAAAGAEDTKVPVQSWAWWKKREDPQVRLLRAEVAAKVAEINLLKAEKALLENRVRELEEKTQVPVETEQEIKARREAETAEINRRGEEKMKRERENPQYSSIHPDTPHMKS